MTNTSRPEMTAAQLAHYTALRAMGHTAQRSIAAARVMIGSADAKRGPRPPYTHR